MPAILRLTIKETHPVLRGWDHYWSVAMEFAARNEAFTTRDIEWRSNTRRTDIRDFLKRLKLAGFIEDAGGEPASYRVVRMQSATPRVRRDGSVIDHVGCNQAMWNTMRSLRCAGRALPPMTWSTGAPPTRCGSARPAPRATIKRLNGAGYLVLRQKGGPQKLALWALLPDMNTGPDAPKVLRSHVVFDPNRQALVGETIAEEEPS
jgi:hypothetical protein